MKLKLNFSRTDAFLLISFIQMSEITRAQAKQDGFRQITLICSGSRLSPFRSFSFEFHFPVYST